MNKIALALVAALSLGVMAGCGSAPSGDAKKIDVVAGASNALTYSPTALTVKKGEKVTVHLDNKDTATAHTFIVKDLNVKSKQVQPGKTEDIVIPTDKTGTFDFHCDVPGHEATMKGTLTVTD